MTRLDSTRTEVISLTDETYPLDYHAQWTTSAPCNALFVSIYTAHLSLTQVETVIETRIVDTTVLIHAAVGRVACTVATRLSNAPEVASLLP
jgi:hypothetical protein